MMSQKEALTSVNETWILWLYGMYAHCASISLSVQWEESATWYH